MSEHRFMYKGFIVGISTSYKGRTKGGNIEIRDVDNCHVDLTTTFYMEDSPNQLLRRAMGMVDELVKCREEFEVYDSQLECLINLNEEIEWL